MLIIIMKSMRYYCPDSPVPYNRFGNEAHCKVTHSIDAYSKDNEPSVVALIKETIILNQ